LSAAILKNADLAAGVNTTVHTVTTGKMGAFTAKFVNRGAASVPVRLAFAATTAPTNAEWVEYNAPVVPGEPLMIPGIALPAGIRIIAYAAAAGVSFNLWGYED